MKEQLSEVGRKPGARCPEAQCSGGKEWSAVADAGGINFQTF